MWIFAFRICCQNLRKAQKPAKVILLNRRKQFSGGGNVVRFQAPAKCTFRQAECVRELRESQGYVFLHLD